MLAKKDQKKRFLLWLAVGLFAVVIIILWAWNLSTLWQDAQIKNSPEKKLWQEAKTGIGNLTK